MKKIGKFLYGTWYGSAACIAVVLSAETWIGFVAVSLPQELPTWVVHVSNGLLLVLALAFLNGLVAIVVSVAKMHGTRAFVQLCCVGGLFFATLYILIVLAFKLLGGPSEDHFFDNYKMPTDIEVADPAWPGGERWASFDEPLGDDAYSLALAACATNEVGSRDKILCDISPLDELACEKTDLLKRYLACHPGWTLRNERFSGLSAKRKTRRFGLYLADRRGAWHMTLPREPDGASSRHEVTATCEVCFDVVPDDGATCKSGESIKAALVGDQDCMTRWCKIVCKGKKVALVTTEVARYAASRVLQPMFDFTRSEFASLKKAGDWESAKKLLPADAIRKGEPSLELFKGVQGGIFKYLAWVNPGERGEVYLRAYEVVSGTRLSKRRMSGQTREYVGWSDDPEEKFSVSSEFTIYEGDWEKYYAARIEVWFVPADGGAERKLVERVFKVDGWQR